MLHLFRRFTGFAAVVSSVAAFHGQNARAAWTALDLPTLSTTFGSYQMAHLPDGRLVYGTDNDIDRQTTFQTSGAVAFDDYANAGAWYPSAVAVFSNTLGVVGEGSFSGASHLYVFDPSNLATPFTAIPSVTLQDYAFVFRDASSLYVGGKNGTDPGNLTGRQNAVSYVTLAGTKQLLIDDISTYSGGMALDASGNLFVTDNDDLKLYEFTAAQLAAAITNHQVLTLNDGAFLTTLSRNSNIAIDSLGRVWSSGFQASGLEMFDPGNGSFTSFIPAWDNTNYIVSTFSAAGAGYVAYLNADGFTAGSNLKYGFDRVENLVPEPSTGLLLLAGLALAHRRRR